MNLLHSLLPRLFSLLLFCYLLAPVAKGQDFEKDFAKASQLVDSTRDLRKAIEIVEHYFNLEAPENLRAVAQQYPKEVMTIAVWYAETSRRPFAASITDFIDPDHLLASSPDAYKGYMLHHYTHYRYHQNKEKNPLPAYQRAYSLVNEYDSLNFGLKTTILSAIGAYYEANGAFMKADSSYINAADINRRFFGTKNYTHAALLNSRAIVYARLANFETAERLYLQSIQAMDSGAVEKDNVLYATVYENIGSLYVSKGLLQQGLDYMLRAAEHKKSAIGEFHPDYATSLNNMAVTYYRMGDYKTSERMGLRALEIRRAVLGENHPLLGYTYAALGSVYEKTARYDEAIASHQKSADIMSASFGEKHPNTVITFGNIAQTNFLLGNYEQARPLFQKVNRLALEVFGEQHPFYTISVGNLGNLYKETGDYHKADSMLTLALQLRKKTLGELHPDYISALHNFGALAETRGDYDAAANAYLRSIELIKQVLGEKHSEYAKSMNNLALLYKKMGRTEEYKNTARAAFELLQSALGEKHPNYFAAMSAQAVIRAMENDHARAEALFRQALDGLSQTVGETHPLYLTALYNRGQYLQERGTTDSAIVLMEKLLYNQNALYPENAPDKSTTQTTLALLHTQNNHPEKARPLWKQGLQIRYNHLIANNIGLSQRERENFTRQIRSELEIYHTFAARHSAQFPGLAGEFYDALLPLKAFQLRNSQALREAVARSGDAALQQRYEEWHTTRLLYARTVSRPIAERTMNADSLERAAEQLEKELSARSAAFRAATDTAAFRWQEVQKALRQGEALVEMSKFRWYGFETNKWLTDSVGYMAVVLAPGMAEPALVVLPEGHRLESLYQPRYAQSVQLRGAGKVAPEGEQPPQSLWQACWAPIAAALPEGVQTVYFVPDGMYHNMNLNTIQNEEGEYLMDLTDLRQLTSGRDLALLRRQAASARPVRRAEVYGFPLYSATASDVRASLGRQPQTSAQSIAFDIDSQTSRTGIAPLPGTLREVQSMETLLKGRGITTTLRTAAAASEDNLRQLSQVPDVLHIATHGFFEPDQERAQTNNPLRLSGADEGAVYRNPYLRCGLYLAGAETSLKGNSLANSGLEDGVLTAYEAAGLPIRGAQLVTLSACETGLGSIRNGEGVFGVQRAFIEAGAEAVLFSLWQVSDVGTEALMREFYGNWIGKGLSRREAFRRAQNTLRTQAAFSSPFFWGAFVLIGE